MTKSWLVLVSYLNEGDFQLSVERHLDCIGLCVTSLYFYSTPWLVQINSRHFLNQSGSQWKPIVAWSLSFSRALSSWIVFTLRSHWLFCTFPRNGWLFWLFWLWFYELRHSIEMRPSTEGNLYSQSRAKSNNSCTPKEITPYEVYHHPEEWCSALFLRNSKIKKPNNIIILLIN